MSSRRSSHPLARVLAAVVIAGCGRTATIGGDLPDGAVDSGTDLAADTTPDPVTDPAPDSPEDPLPDPVTDTAPDTAPDPVVDTGSDLPVDTGLDTSSDTPWEPPWDVPPDGPPAGAVGDPCFMDDNCMGVPSSARVCLRDLMGYISFPRGYCSAECTSDGECGTGGECVMFFGMGSYCLKRCSSPAECRTAEGYECTTLPMGSTTYCLPEFSPGADDGSSVDY